MRSVQAVNDSFGIIGTGAIAQDIVDGLGDTAKAVFLSPRGARTAQALADRHAHVQVCADNQSVIDAAPLVLLAVRPDQVPDALAGLRVPDDRVLISAVAGWTADALRARLGTGATIVRSIPLPAVRRRQGVTALYPGHPVAEELFGHLGGTVVAESAAVFDALSAATASISSYLNYVDTVAAWIAGQGLDLQAAENYVRSMFTGVSAALADQRTTLPELARAHETPQGNNEALRTKWFTAENRAALEDALEHIRERVTQPR